MTKGPGTPRPGKHADLALNRALELHRQGKLGEAESGYRAVLAAAPDHADAWLNLGIVLQQQGRLAEALGCYDRAVTLQPKSPEARYNRGNVLRNLGRLQEAVASYDQALALRPAFAEALNNRGNALQGLDRLDDALESYDAALRIRPAHADTLNSRGAALQRLHRLDAALESFNRALALRPDYPEALFNRGIALQELKRWDDALASYDQALALRPEYPDAWNNRSIVLQSLNRPEEALLSCDRALTLRPDFAPALNNRGIALQSLNRPAEALASFDRALALKPHDPVTLNNRGNALEHLDRPDEALASFDRALSLQPDYAEAHHNRGNALQLLKRTREALASYESALAIRPDYPYLPGTCLFTRMRMCDWAGLAALVNQITTAIDAGRQVASPFDVLATPLSLAQQRACAETYVRDKFPARGARPGRRPAAADGRIRLGYFSADFRQHPVAYLTAELFERHDRSRFELFAISFGPPTRDDMRARMEAAFDHFIDVRDKSDADVARLARELGIDIGVDLMGFTERSRTGIFACRAAPVQVNYLGYAGTLGSDFMDYLIADATLIPQEHRGSYAEKIVWLPHTFQVNDSGRPISAQQFTRREVGLPEQGFVFCNLNNYFKIAPGDFDIWMRLLGAVDGSVLWLIGTDATAEENLRKEARARGVSPDRLVFKKRKALLADHRAQLRLADLFVDSLFYNAHTTASDALWAGLPLLTRLGETYASRVAASLLRAVGLPDLITPTTAAYETLALELARKPGHLAALKARLAANRLTTPLFDTTRFTRHIETAYTAMWQRHQSGLPPDHIVVGP